MSTCQDRSNLTPG